MTTLARLRELVHGAVRAPEENVVGATTQELDTLEQRLNRPLPNQLRDFLSICNGARIGPGGFFGVRPDNPDLDIIDLLDQWDQWHTPRWLPVAGDGCGNYYVITPDGQVGFVDTMADPGSLAGEPFPDLFTCIEELLEDDQESHT